MVTMGPWCTPGALPLRLRSGSDPQRPGLGVVSAQRAALRSATAAAEAAAVDAEAIGEARRSEKVLVPWGF